MFKQKLLFGIAICFSLCNLSYGKSYKNDLHSVLEDVNFENQNSSISSYDDLGRFLSSGSIPNIGQIITNLTMSLSGITGNSSCVSDAVMLETLKVPIYIILPAIIIGVVILIVKIGLAVVWLPTWSGPIFSAFNPSSDSGGYSSNSGWSMPVQSGYPAAPSPAYGPSSLSRQTAILESIDDLNNQYNQPVNSNLGSPSYSNMNSNNNDNSQYDTYYYTPNQMVNSLPAKG